MQVEDATRRCVALRLGSSRCTSPTETPHPADYHTHVDHTEHRHTSACPSYSEALATVAQYPGFSPDALASQSRGNDYPASAGGTRLTMKVRDQISNGRLSLVVPVILTQRFSKVWPLERGHASPYLEKKNHLWWYPGHRMSRC
jgi:hypothetical protein